ncbi:branched-chain amino acid ABC transporter substrate-binding protein [Methylovulum psychrotolerans]|uniref:Branched-chain amino acid ABC transporter substrate-binding protein n=1 Tax=Methylovulum psychrotolerans TaxID=1704499 RepID=A0A1Z4C3S4_9GAMM|nr:branched-chain amino acid ABC transporter substrate-binding protein [Methylovulum psychrotolerans]MBT9096394.1 ABC transporter substrate-binding protein [Methylovulum psychrotolerans]POZ52515.1 branched-chain amino acid ABC transporter substrate-binding protein [Methylovulum psychrotolerans]
MLIKVIFHTLCFSLAISLAAVAAENKQVIDIAYLTQETVAPPQLSNIDPFIKNKGVFGAELAIADNNTTGQFTHQQFRLKAFTVPVDGNVEEVFGKQIAGKYRYVVTVLPPAPLLKIADSPAAKALLLLDAATIDDSLRNGQCRANVLHLLPSRSMRADALAQYMTKKRWVKWFLVVGTTEQDTLYAEALKRAAKRFNMEIIAEKTWEHTFDARRTAQSDVAVFSQVDDYDVLVVADEQGAFGEYLDYRTWLPRPVIGTQGLVATAWHRTHDQWGATQLQNRFTEKAGRTMAEEDYGAYLAVRALGEAATRTKSTELAALKSYLLGDKFALQGYKSNPLSFRAWDGQLRQPILLAAPRAMVAVAPIDGFLHQKTELDTLGYDQPETQCHWQ